MAILLCQLLLLFSETLLPAERPLRHSGDTSYYAHRLLAGSRHQEWIGRGWASPLYKHRLLVNFGALIREKFVLASFFSHHLSAPACLSGVPGSCKLQAAYSYRLAPRTRTWKRQGKTEGPLSYVELHKKGRTRRSHRAQWATVYVQVAMAAHRDWKHLPAVVAIPGCQLDYIWNELQSRIGRLTSDPYLEAWRSLSGSWYGDLEP